MTASIMVTGVGVATPWGSVASELPPVTSTPVPGDETWFDPRTRLGPRGYKYLPAACQYLLAAARDALGERQAPEPTRSGVAVGTNLAAAGTHSTMDYTIIHKGAESLSPASAPFFAVNVFGSRLAIEQRAKAFSLTLTAPRIAGLESLQIASRALRMSRADLALAGATETPGPPGGADTTGAAGAAVFVLETAERAVDPLGTVETVSAFVSPRTPAAGPVVDGAWRSLAAEGYPVTLYADDCPVTDSLAGALGTVTSEVTVRAPGTGCVAPAWHVASLLARRAEPQVVAAVSRTGNAVFTAITTTGGSRDQRIA
ncbi:MAG: beta-ketoacyl synthase N-terminal-like domain-containing protein [Stackebrandtia sp.]